MSERNGFDWSDRILLWGIAVYVLSKLGKEIGEILL